MPVQFWTFHFVKQLGRKAACTQNHRGGLRHAVQLDPLVLVFWAICPSLALFGGGDWPFAGYYGLANPGSGVFLCWNKISTHECSQSLGRLLGRAAVIVTRYGRIERMVPHRVLIFIVVGASKIKAIESSFGDRVKMKRLLLLRETNDRGDKI